jgi:hypothetical protein
VAIYADPSTDARAVKKPSPSTERIASAWTTTTTQNASFTIDLNISGSHQVAIYCVDWLGSGTILQCVEVFESSDGIYLSYTLSGHKVIRVQKLGGTPNDKAMVSGIFFGP